MYSTLRPTYSADTNNVPSTSAFGSVRLGIANLLGDVHRGIPAAVSVEHEDQADRELRRDGAGRRAYGGL